MSQYPLQFIGCIHYPHLPRVAETSRTSMEKKNWKELKPTRRPRPWYLSPSICMLSHLSLRPEMVEISNKKHCGICGGGSWAIRGVKQLMAQQLSRLTGFSNPLRPRFRLQNTLKGLGASFQFKPATARAHNHFRLARFALIFLMFQINAVECWKLGYTGW